MAHGYYNLKGAWVGTSTKAEATTAWRAERGYSTGGVYDVGGGEVVDTRNVQQQTGGATTSATTTETSVERNARLQAQFDKSTTWTGSTINQRRYSLPQFGTQPNVPKPTTPNVPAHEDYRLAQLDTGYAHETARLQQNDRGAPTTSFWDKVFQPQGTQNILGKTLDALNMGGEYHSPWTVPEAEKEIQVVESKYTGRQYYQGGSERAYLGPVAQAEEYFFGTGDRWGLDSSYLDIAPEDRKPPPVLNQSTVRILTKSGPSYLEGVDYGPSMTMEDIERIYEFDPVTGHYLLKDTEAPVYDYGYGNYTPGYGAGYGGGYGPGYGSVSRGPSGFGLVNWRIG